MRVYPKYSAPLLHYLNSTFLKGANKGQTLFFMPLCKKPHIRSCY
nr:MAG TPA: hypothetical protein [Caudoviricetes sp.]